MHILDILDNFHEVSKEFKIGKSNYWILMNKDEIDSFENIFEMDKDVLNECNVTSDNSSKIVFFDNYMFLNLNILAYREGIIKNRDLNIYLSKDCIITVYNNNISIINDLINDIRELKNCFMLKNNPKPAIVLYYILDRIIIKHYNIMSEIEAKADKIEICILKNPCYGQADDLIHLRRQLYKIRKFLNPLRYIGDSLVSNDNKIIDEEDINHFYNINGKINKLMANLESLVQGLALVREAFESEVSNKTNEFMKIFTIITSIFLPLDLIASMYGMNFKNMPFTHLKYGHYYLTMIMIIISIILILIFKNKKWM